MSDEVGPAGLGGSEMLAVFLNSSSTLNLVGVALTRSFQVRTDVLAGLDNVAVDIESVTRSLGNCQAIVQSDDGRNSTKADDHTPHLVNSEIANASALGDSAGGLEGFLETSGNDQSDYGTGQLADTLHGEDGSHHGAAPLGRRKSTSVSS